MFNNALLNMLISFIIGSALKETYKKYYTLPCFITRMKELTLPFN